MVEIARNLWLRRTDLVTMLGLVDALNGDRIILFADTDEPALLRAQITGSDGHEAMVTINRYKEQP